MPPIDLEAKLEEHSARLDDLIRLYDQQQTGVQVDRKEAEDKTRDVLKKHDALEEGYRQRRMALQERITAARQLVASIKASDGSIDADALLAEVELARQATFDHALLVVAAGEGSLDRIRNISDDHRKALGIVEAEKAKADLLKTVGDRDSTIRDLESTITEKNEDLKSKNEELKSKNEELKSKNEELKSKNEELKRTRGELEASRQKAQASVEESKSSEAKYAALGQKYAALERELEASKQQLVAREAEKTALSGELATTQNNKQEVEGKLATVRAELGSAKEAVRVIEEEARRQQAAFDGDLAALLAQHEAGEGALERRVHELEMFLEEERFRAAALSQSHANVSLRLADAERSCAAAQQTNAALTEARDLLGALRDDEARQLRDSESTVDELVSVVFELAGEIADLELSVEGERRTVRDRESDIGRLEGDVERLETTVRGLETKVNGLETKVNGLETKVNGLETKVNGLETKVNNYDDSLENANAELEELKSELEGANHRLDEELQTSESLRNDADAASAERDRAEAAELGLAEFFAVQSGWDGAEFQSWVPFVRAVSRADYVAGLPASADRPWTVLQSWCEGGGRGLHDHTPASLAHVAGRLYGAALNGDCGEESICLVGQVMGHLVRDDTVSLPPVVTALEAYVDAVSRIDLARCDQRIHVLCLGLWQVASVVRSLRPGAEQVDRIALDIGSLVDSDSLCRELRELMWDPEVAEAELRDLPVSQNHFFVGDSRICLLAVSGVPDWLFAIDFGERSIGMVHVSRGEWAGIQEYRIRASEGGRDLTVPVTSAQRLGWVLNHFSA
ncbi:hypothetical protein DL770_008596 [Monosporascus sp. CRB-9-2]|nr:hypothetical protein DL770_008596 [Monosporascus sp. CRB-9-2]